MSAWVWAALVYGALIAISFVVVAVLGVEDHHGKTHGWGKRLDDGERTPPGTP